MHVDVYTNVMIRFLLQFVLIMTYTFNKEKERLFIAIPIDSMQLCP